MKIVKYVLSICLVALAVYSCAQDDDNTDFVDSVEAPTNVSANVVVTQDNTGLVTITPIGEGVTNYIIGFGDGSDDSDAIQPGNGVNHTYEEGTYEATITASAINGLTTTVTQSIIVSFLAPENLMVTIENDVAVSKQVNITASADFAISYEVNFGDPANTVIMTNINEPVSFIYDDAGIYTITVTAMSAAIETTSYSEDFEVTAILQPTSSAPTPPTRAESDVISIFSSAYTDVSGTNYFPDWGQGGLGSSWTMFDLAGDEILQYINLSYQGIVLEDGTTVDVSQMEYLHLDVWTDEVVTDIETSIINNASGTVTEAPATRALTPNSWTSIEIPVSEYMDQGLTVTEIFQLKFVGTPSASGTVFIDNIYFYRESGTTVSCGTLQDFEGTPPAFTVFGNIADTQVVANPDMTGENTTANVAQLTKTNGSEVWAGTYFDLSSPVDFSTCSIISVKTWSPKVGAVVKFKLENSANGDESFEVDLNTSVMNSWEELTYDFSAAPVFNYDRAVIFFDFGEAGDDSIYYYDEIQLVGNSGGADLLAFQDFEGVAPEFSVFGNIADSQVVINPDMSGVNTTANVAQLTKTNGSEIWAGTFFDVSPSLDLTTYTKIKLKTWSPKVGAVVKLKVENSANGDESFEVDLTTTVANSWEELTYDFSAAQEFNYDRVVVFFDFGVAGDDAVYYFDEFVLTN